MGILGDPKHHFAEIFRFLGQHFASEGLPKRARRPPEGARRCFLVDFGVPAEAPNPTFSDSAPSKKRFSLHVLSKQCFDLVLGSVLTCSGLDFKPKSWEGCSKSRFQENRKIHVLGLRFT